LSQQVQRELEACNIRARRCIADALDTYATGLLAEAPRLPPELRTLPIVVETAATKVRLARTKKEAMSALTSAIAQIHKSIGLLRIDDPVILKAATREEELVAETLQVADNQLEKAMGL
jgi:hypothetical protein